MIGSQKVVVVLPAFHAGKTLERTAAGIPLDVADEVLLVDDASEDETAEARRVYGLDVLGCAWQNARWNPRAVRSRP